MNNVRYEWIDHDGNLHQTVERPNSCETPLPVRRITFEPEKEEGIDLQIENLVGGFRNYGHRVDGQPVSEEKRELLDDLRKGMMNVEYILEHTRGSRAQKLKVLHERLPEPCFGVSL